VIESGTPLGPGFFIFFQQETGQLSPQQYRSRYYEPYEDGILSKVFTQYIEIEEKDPIKEIRVPDQQVIKHLQDYVKDHSLDARMSRVIIAEIAKRPDLVKQIENSHGLKKTEAREVLFDALLDDLTFKVEKDEQDIALLMILIEVI
jgi:hypothetical protein